MARSSYTLLYIRAIGILLCTLLVGCDNRTVYNHYEHTPVTGWERNDTLKFEVEAVEADGTYSEEIGLRINNSYPFMGLTLIVEQTRLPGGKERTDTLSCQLIRENGIAIGKGMSHYQYLFPLKPLHLHEGDRLRIAIHHIMKREILPGISDVGIQIARKPDSD